MIKDNLLNDIKLYCQSNNIDDVSKLVNKMLTRGFSIEKFGETPKKAESKPKVIEKIVEKEIIKEVPVEIEKIVEKEVFISDDKTITKLQNDLNSVESSLKGQISNLENKIKQLKNEKAELISKYENIIKELKNNKDLYGE